MKKILMFTIFSIITAVHAYNPDHVTLVLDPKQMTLNDLDLRGANLANKNLSGKIFVSTDFRGTTLSKSFFIGCYFIDCIFVDALVKNTIFLKAQFWDCNLLKMRGTETLLNNFVLNLISKLTYSGKGDATLYPQYGKLYQIGSQKIIASGLCRKIYDEAQNAIKKDA